MKIIATVIVVMSLFITPVPAFSHHSDAAYGTTSIALKDATIVKILWTNPHGIVACDVKDENGKVDTSGESDGESAGGGDDVDDNLYQDAIRVVCDAGRASTSTLQRRLRIGYGRAARLIDLMEKDGIVGPPDGTKPREVLKGRNWMKEFDDTTQ